MRWAVGEGHTVFMVSWRNIPPELGRLTWDDYLEQGVLTALGLAREISGSRKVNALGFCVGGTLLACALAVAAARGDRSVASLTLLTTMLDFADPGDIGVYISRELVAAREPALMAGQRIHGTELASAFASLRANELVWNYVVNNYLKGETPPAFDLLHWNGDSPDLPGPMFADYLRNFYLDNKLRESGALTMAGERIDLANGDDAGVHRGVARRSHRAVAIGLPVDATCSAANARSSWARPATSRASSIRRRRTGATTGRTRGCRNRRTTGSKARRRIREAGGRTGARGSRGTPGRGARRRMPRATPAMLPSSRPRAATSGKRRDRSVAGHGRHVAPACANMRVPADRPPAHHDAPAVIAGGERTWP